MQTLGPLKLKKTGLEVRPAVFSEQTEKSYFFFKYLDAVSYTHLTLPTN